MVLEKQTLEGLSAETQEHEKGVMAYLDLEDQGDIFKNIVNKLSCSVGKHDWVCEGDYSDEMTGIVFGKIYRCSRCGIRKWVAYTGRVYF